MSKLDKNGYEVLRRRYLVKDKDGNPSETPEELFHRVAEVVASAETDEDKKKLYANKFFEMMNSLDFLPNSPTLMNAGRPLGQLSACFVLPIEDSMDGIFGTLKKGAIIHKTGGGTGYSFSNIRQRDARVESTGGKASGPISFMTAYDAATATVAQGGCFKGSTLVMTKTGVVKIKELKEGTMVLTKFLDGSVGWTPCTAPFLTKRKVSVVEVWIGRDPIVCTPDHPFMVGIETNTSPESNSVSYKYKKAIELVPGDIIVGSLFLCDDRDKVNSDGKLPTEVVHWNTNCSTLMVDKVVASEKLRNVWNVEVPETHNYAVCSLYDSKPLCAQYIYNCAFVSNTRRGANMGLLRVDHPDIMEFIKVKEDLTKLTNFNLSVGITDDFMAALSRGIHDDEYALIDPHTREIVGYMSASVVWDAIINSAWKCGEPGIVFLDRVNENNFLKPLYGDIESTNPCVSGDTLIVVRRSEDLWEEVPIQDVVDQEVEVWNGWEWSKVTPKVTGHNERSLIITISNGAKICCTLNHKFVLSTGTRVEAKDLEKHMPLASWRHPNQYKGTPRVKKYVVNIEEGPLLETTYCLTEPLRHTFMANGIVVGNCGEQPLLPYEACNLGSINLANFVNEDNGTIDYERLRVVTAAAVRFLDDVIDVNKYPLPEIEKMCLSTRKIGLGVMGFADMLQMMNIAYASEEAFKIAESVMSFIQTVAHYTSAQLAVERGPYPAYIDLHSVGHEAPCRRNAMVTTIAPTGSISAIAGVSSGIEPLFSNVFYKHYMDDDYHPIVNERLMRELEELGSEDWVKQVKDIVMATGTVAHIDSVPDYIKGIYACAHDITPQAHVRMQAIFQKHVDNAISKTVNFNSDATREDIAKTYQMAYAEGCKGITVYRDKCRDTQTLNIGRVETKSEEVPPPVEPEQTDPSYEYKILQGLCEVAEDPLKLIDLEKEDPAVAAGVSIYMKAIKDGLEIQKERDDTSEREIAKRPEILHGSTKCVPINCGKLYVTVNHDDENNVFEVFTTNGKGGGCPAQSEAVCRLASLLLRAGVGKKEIVRQLRGIKCTACMKNPKINVLSCPDAIGRELESGAGVDWKNIREIRVPPMTRLNVPELITFDFHVSADDEDSIEVKGDTCPQCGTPLAHEGGCVACPKCGFSSCG